MSWLTGFGRLASQVRGRLAIGIDIGTHSIKAVQVERTNGGLAKVVAAMSRRRSAAGPVTLEEAKALAEGLRTASFAGNTAVLAAPPSDAIITTLELPPRSSNAPLNQLARMELARSTRMAPDGFEMAWWELPQATRASRVTRAMAVAVAHPKSEALLHTVEAARFDIAAIDVEAAALVRACTTALSTKGISAILDLSAGPASLSFVLQGVIVFNRRLAEVSVASLQTELCQRLSIEADVAEYLLAEIGLGGSERRAGSQSDEVVELPDEGRRLVTSFTDALTRELDLSIDYAAHLYPDIPVVRLLLAGGGAAIAGLAQRLASALSIEVKVVSPMELVDCDPGLQAICASPALTLALGLATYESR